MDDEIYPTHVDLAKHVLTDQSHELADLNERHLARWINQNVIYADHHMFRVMAVSTHPE